MRRDVALIDPTLLGWAMVILAVGLSIAALLWAVGKHSTELKPLSDRAWRVLHTLWQSGGGVALSVLLTEVLKYYESLPGDSVMTTGVGAVVLTTLLATIKGKVVEGKKEKEALRLKLEAGKQEKISDPTP